MALFSRKSGSGRKQRNSRDYPFLDKSVLKENNITRLTIDERWTRLFAGLPMPPSIEKLQNEVNELIKKEAMLRQEQETLEPSKKKVMNKIISLTKEAFDDNDAAAKAELGKCKREIERINGRMEEIVGDIEKVTNELQDANLKLLNETVQYIFSTLKKNRERAEAIARELQALEQKERELKRELAAINLDWTSYAVNFTELLGAENVKRLESLFGLEGLKHEAGNTGTDEEN